MMVSPEDGVWRLVTLVVLMAGCRAQKGPVDATDPAEDSGIDPTEGSWVNLDAGYRHTCGMLPSGAVECQGDDQFGQSTPPAGAFEQISAGMHHTCALTTHSTVTCWGFDAFGQTSPPSGTFQEVSAGGYQTCGVTTADAIACWGGIRDGEADAPDESFVSVSAGEGHTCGITASDTVKCWGFDHFGQAQAPEGTFSSVSAGWAHTCGISTDGSVLCWGNDDDGESSPPAGAFRSVSAGTHFNCGITTDGWVSCWGLNSVGQSTPPEGEFDRVSAGGAHACGVQTSGETVCWGADTPTDDAGPEPGAGFRTAGIAWDLGDYDWAQEGLCVHIVDPGEALTDDADVIVLGSASIAAGGAFEVHGIVSDSPVGLATMIDDCNDVEAVIPTATGIPAAAYQDLGDGDLLGGQMAIVIDVEFGAAIDESLALAGYDGTIETDGLMAGFVLDNTYGFIGGATVDCGGCASVFYSDDDPADGLFTTAGVVNGATSAAAESFFVVPGAPFVTYEATAEGYVFSQQPFGSIGGMVSFLAFFGD